VIAITKATGNFSQLVQEKLARSPESFGEVDRVVEEIMEDVRRRGDEALLEYTARFDGVFLDSFAVKEGEIQQALKSLDPELKEVLIAARDNIATYHQEQKEKSWYTTRGFGIVLGQKVTALGRVGVYVPGGKAAYPSTVLMTVVPAVVAGVQEIVMVSPPDREGRINPTILAAAAIAGCKKVYKVGGAQAIAALAYGTATIPKVEKIVGPGNIYVARAKKYAFGTVDIDMIAGPSEICIIADETAQAPLVAADLLSQAEHDELAAAVLITTSERLAQQVQEEIAKQLQKLPRREIAQQSLKSFGNIFLVDTLEEAFALANEIAPEHLELMVESPFEILPLVKNAGAVFLGSYSPEPLGDYFAGPNHTLPTSGTAKFSSPLGTYDFMKKSSVIYYDQEELRKVKDKIIKFATAEGLDAHANSVRIRFSGSE
jgi:histidinol dehydrogenase